MILVMVHDCGYSLLHTLCPAMIKIQISANSVSGKRCVVPGNTGLGKCKKLV